MNCAIASRFMFFPLSVDPANQFHEFLHFGARLLPSLRDGVRPAPGLRAGPGPVPSGGLSRHAKRGDLRLHPTDQNGRRQGQVDVVTFRSERYGGLDQGLTAGLGLRTSAVALLRSLTMRLTFLA